MTMPIRRRIADERLRVAGPRPVEVHADARRAGRLLLAGDVVGHAEARPDDELRKRVVRLRDALPGWNKAVRQVAASSAPACRSPACVFGPRNWPVSGFIAWRLVPVQGYTPLAQPAT